MRVRTTTACCRTVTRHSTPSPCVSPKRKANFWNSALQIVGFDKVREDAFRPWAADTVPRRFCRAVAMISDGSKHAVNFSIGEDTGFIGQTWGVTWCVIGLDRNWAYNPHCKMALP